MREIEHFLEQDYRFRGYTQELKFYPPGPERDAWLDNFFRRVWWGGHFKTEEVMIRSRVYQACVYTTLHDEQEDYLIQCERTYGPSHVEEGGGDALDSIRMKSERTYGPSHVEDGGGDALDSIRMKSERTYGPSHVVDGGGDAFHLESGVMHRSSAVTDGSGSLSSSIVGTESGPTTGLTGTCAGCSSPPNTGGAFPLEG
jgi:hypothetical protein